MQHSTTHSIRNLRLLGLIALLLAITGLNSGCRDDEEPAPQKRYLGVVVVGSGRVDSNPGDIDCTESGGTCDFDYDANKEVVLTAYPNTGHQLSAWKGACAGTAASLNKCTVKMLEARTVEVRFEPVPEGTMLLTVETSGDGEGYLFTVPDGITCGEDCAEAFKKDSEVTLIAKTDENSVFAGWSEGSVCAVNEGHNNGKVALNGKTAATSKSAKTSKGVAFKLSSGATTTVDAVCVIKMSEARTVGAKFSPTPLTLTIEKVGEGQGTVTSEPSGIACGADCEKVFPIQTSVKLTAVADTGTNNQFTGWGGACKDQGTNPECTVTISKAQTVIAKFDPVPPGKAMVSVMKSGKGAGTISSTPAGLVCGTNCSKPFTKGETVTLTVAVTAGSHFVGWSGACTGTNLTCSFTLDENKSVDAEFSLEPRKLTVAKTGTGGGSIITIPEGIDCGATCEANFDHGASVTIVANADNTSTFASWSGACSGTMSACVVTMSEAKNVTATFNKTGAILTIVKAGDGAGTVASAPTGINCGETCQAGFADGMTVTLTATAASGSKFASWSGACTGTGSTCTVVVDAAKSVSATFELLPTSYTLTIVNPDYTIGRVTSPVGIDCGSTCTKVVATGATVNLNASILPSVIGSFGGWAGVTGCGTGVNCSFTMDADKTVTANFSGGCPIGHIDLDGNPTNGCEYACTATSATDSPNDAGDANCDGVDGEANLGVFVAITGSDANPGTRVAPKRTITAGATLATATGKSQVFIASGNYGERVNLQSNLTYLGSYANWLTRSATPSTMIQPAGATTDNTAVYGVGVSQVELNRLHIIAPTPMGSSPTQRSSYAARCIMCSSLRITNSHLQAQNALAGVAGTTPTGPVKASNGGAGTAGTCSTNALYRAGGFAGTSSYGVPGGIGGYANYSTSVNGAAGGGTFGGAYGTAGTSGSASGTTTAGTDGSNGGPGTLGSQGPGATYPAGMLGTFNSNGLWSGNNGTPGGLGLPGGGGGGGGAGGIGGNGGGGGNFGGSSIALMLHNSNDTTVMDSQFTTGNGGNGGDGATGSAGGLGGDGGAKGDGITCSYGTGSAGGKGGNGGQGGLGGTGGGGTGGHAFGIVAISSSITRVGSTYNLGSPGSGGAGGGAVNGWSQNYWAP